MNWLDIIIAAFLILAIIKGYRSGFVMQAAALTGLTVSVIFAGKLSEMLYPYLSHIIDTHSYIISPISYMASFTLITIGVCLAGKTIESFIKIIQLSFFNRFLGAFFSLITWGIGISVILILVANFDQKQVLLKAPARQASCLFEPMVEFGELLVPFLKTKSDNILPFDN